MNLQTDTTITSSSKLSERKTDSETDATSNEEPSASQAESVMYSSGKTSTHIDLNRANTPVSIENKPIDKKEDKEEKEEEDVDEEEDDDDDDDFPKFEGGEARGRIVHPVAGPKTRPVRPK